MKRNQRSPIFDSRKKRRLAKAAKLSSCGSSSLRSAGSTAPPTFLDELIEPVLAQLSISQIDALKQDSKLWASMLQTPSLRRACAVVHPRVFGLVRWNPKRDAIMTSIFDLKSSEWVDIQLTEFPRDKDYEDAMSAADGGLVCFVPRIGEKLSALPILVYNPLTNDRNFIPKCERSPFGKKRLILVQLVMDEEMKCYKVMLVYGESYNEASGAVVYDSRTGLWTKKNDGVVFGAGNTLLHGQCNPRIFDCSHKSMHGIGDLYEHPRSFSSSKNHLFVLEEITTPPGKFKLSEYTLSPREITVRDLKTLSGPSEEEGYDSVLLACNGFILLAWDYHDEEDDDGHDQIFKLHDIAGNKEYNINADSITPLEILQRSLICDLRWEAIP
ncbi:hypothetical protein KC19_10G125200 [Ceratodon purpureus]|uniref:F-box protein n=1 Tax=Ceratodon purpureus TaxID=3225 RepID=A0A8T0GNA8_CERPU|nr:hypothetical protein KC19_10G125200 [Ceratodon purpureus]